MKLAAQERANRRTLIVKTPRIEEVTDDDDDDSNKKIIKADHSNLTLTPSPKNSNLWIDHHDRRRENFSSSSSSSSSSEEEEDEDKDDENLYYIIVNNQKFFLPITMGKNEEEMKRNLVEIVGHHFEKYLIKHLNNAEKLKWMDYLKELKDHHMRLIYRLVVLNEHGHEIVDLLDPNVKFQREGEDDDKSNISYVVKRSLGPTNMKSYSKLLHETQKDLHKQYLLSMNPFITLEQENLKKNISSRYSKENVYNNIREDLQKMPVTDRHDYSISKAEWNDWKNYHIDSKWGDFKRNLKATTTNQIAKTLDKKAIKAKEQAKEAKIHKEAKKEFNKNQKIDKKNEEIQQRIKKLENKKMIVKAPNQPTNIGSRINGESLILSSPSPFVNIDVEVIKAPKEEKSSSSSCIHIGDLIKEKFPDFYKEISNLDEEIKNDGNIVNKLNSELTAVSSKKMTPPTLTPIRSKNLPDLIPISSRNMPALIPVSSLRNMPELAPIPLGIKFSSVSSMGDKTTKSNHVKLNSLQSSVPIKEKATLDSSLSRNISTKANTLSNVKTNNKILDDDGRSFPVTCHYQGSADYVKKSEETKKKIWKNMKNKNIPIQSRVENVTLSTTTTFSNNSSYPDLEVQWSKYDKTPTRYKQSILINEKIDMLKTVPLIGVNDQCTLTYDENTKFTIKDNNLKNRVRNFSKLTFDDKRGLLVLEN